MVTLLQTIESSKSSKEDRREPLILFWTKIYGAVRTPANLPFRFDSCRPPGNRCRMTTDRSLVKESDVVLFYIWDINFNDMPTFRSLEQRWGFFNMESPQLTSGEEHFRNLPPHFRFNWTLTYRQAQYMISLHFIISSSHFKN